MKKPHACDAWVIQSIRVCLVVKDSSVTLPDFKPVGRKTGDLFLMPSYEMGIIPQWDIFSTGSHNRSTVNQAKIKYRGWQDNQVSKDTCC